MKKQLLGQTARFYLPSLKLKQMHEERMLEQVVHSFLVKQFGRYTATLSTVFGYWIRDDGKEIYLEHREYSVAFHPDRAQELDYFIGKLAQLMGEQCIYLDDGHQAWLIYSDDAKVPENK